MQSGRSSIGSHKHAISGYSGPSPKTKMWRMIHENRELAGRKKQKPLPHRGVIEAVRHFRPR